MMAVRTNLQGDITWHLLQLLPRQDVVLGAPQTINASTSVPVFIPGHCFPVASNANIFMPFLPFFSCQSTCLPIHLFFFFSLPGHQKCELSQELLPCQHFHANSAFFRNIFMHKSPGLGVLKSGSPLVSPRVDDPRSGAKGDFLNGRTAGHNTRMRSLLAPTVLHV